MVPPHVPMIVVESTVGQLWVCSLCVLKGLGFYLPLCQVCPQPPDTKIEKMFKKENNKHSTPKKCSHLLAVRTTLSAVSHYIPKFPYTTII